MDINNYIEIDNSLNPVDVTSETIINMVKPKKYKSKVVLKNLDYILEYFKQETDLVVDDNIVQSFYIVKQQVLDYQK